MLKQNNPLYKKRSLFSRLTQDISSRLECDNKRSFRRSSNAPAFRRYMNVTDRANYSTEVPFEPIKQSQRIKTARMIKIGAQSELPSVMSGNKVQYSTECDPQRRILYKGSKIIGPLLACLIEISSLHGRLLIAAEIMGTINASITLPLDSRQSAQHYREDADYQDLLERLIIEKQSDVYSMRIQPGLSNNPEVKNVINKKARVLGFLARNCNFEKQSIVDISEIKVSKKAPIRGNRKTWRPKAMPECAAICLKAKEPRKESQTLAQQEADCQPDYEIEFHNQDQERKQDYAEEEMIDTIKQSASLKPQEQVCCEIVESMSFES